MRLLYAVQIALPWLARAHACMNICNNTHTHERVRISHTFLFLLELMSLALLELRSYLSLP